MTQSTSKHQLNLESQVRYAHIDGHTDLALQPGPKSQIVTAGVDGEVRIWSTDPADDGVKCSFSVEDQPYALACTNDRIYVALASNCVKSYQFDDGENEMPVCRFASNATCLAIHVDGELLAAGSADFTVKLCNLLDNTCKTLEGHQGPLLSVAIDPLRKFLASSATDGTVRLWSIGSKTVCHQWNQLFKRSNDFETSSVLCRIAWEPNGTCLAIPRADRVELYKRGQWEKAAVDLVHPDLQHFSLTCFSADGKYLAAATTSEIKSALVVWLMDQPRTAHSLMSGMEHPFTSIQFNPADSKQLFAMDSAGMLHIATIGHGKPTASSPAPPATTTNDDVLADFEMDDDLIFMDDENENKSEPVKKSQLNETKDIQENHFEIGDEPQAYEFDISAIKSRYEPLIFGDTDDRQHENVRTQNGSISNNGQLVIEGQKVPGRQLLELINGPRYQAPMRQAPFQSGSTPAHYQHRFMVWNGIGIVYAHETDEEHSIDVEFHDASFHQSIHMANMYNYSMADLSAACLLLASNGDDCDVYDDGQLKCRLFCLMFQTWDAVKEWQIDLPKGEKFCCIAAGENFVAGMTSERYLRVWTVGGVQTMIRSMEGSAINLSAFDNRLMALIHSASNHADDGQTVSGLVLTVDHVARARNHLIPYPVPVALAPRSTVYWAGFTDEGSPCVVDSDGIVRLWASHFGDGWFPVLATKQHAGGRSDNFFVVGLSEFQNQVRCIFCKASRYPDTVPKPTLTLLPFQVPLCELDPSIGGGGIKAKCEEECLRNRWLISSIQHRQADEEALMTMAEGQKRMINSLIKLFAVALGAERESVAFEVAKLLPNLEALKGAVKYAQQKKHRSLAMKLVQLLERDQDVDQEQDDLEPVFTLAHRKSNDHLDEVSLRPKSPRPDSSPVTSPVTTRTRELEEDVEPNLSPTLKPKPIANACTTHRNPFKASGSSSKPQKRKQLSPEEDRDGRPEADKGNKITRFFNK